MRMHRGNEETRVIAGLDPAISITVARLCQLNRDDRDKPGHDHHRCLTSWRRGTRARLVRAAIQCVASLISTRPTMLTRLCAMTGLPLRSTVMLRTMSPPPGMTQV